MQQMTTFLMFHCFPFLCLRPVLLYYIRNGFSFDYVHSNKLSTKKQIAYMLSISDLKYTFKLNTDCTATIPQTESDKVRNNSKTEEEIVRLLGIQNT